MYAEVCMCHSVMFCDVVYVVGELINYYMITMFTFLHFNHV